MALFAAPLVGRGCEMSGTSNRLCLGMGCSSTCGRVKVQSSKFTDEVFIFAESQSTFYHSKLMEFGDRKARWGPSLVPQTLPSHMRKIVW